ncbi:hypothetical protein G6023_09880, partial [Dietzia sp. DQ11-71]|nr:hypothetical protein [Dietzia sp. DQ11-71]
MPPTPSAGDSAGDLGEDAVDGSTATGPDAVDGPPAGPDADDGPRTAGRDSVSDPVSDPVPTASAAPGPARRVAAVVLLALPLVLAALWAVVGPTPQQEEAGPGAGGPLRSALSEASANSSFTVAGADQLRSGSAELADGAEQLRAGSAELAAGMEQLQAGIGQAGTGATELADGVGQVVGAVRGVAVIQGQVSTAIDDALSRLQGDDPDTVRAREALIGLRDQLATQGLDQNTLSGLDQLEGGADELARQLAAPGAPLRDGVFEATRGSRDLAAGAGE